MPDHRARHSYHPLWELTLARLREFSREPAAIFWVYVFPLIMMISLGLAFRNQPVERVAVDVQQGADSRLIAALQNDPRFLVRVCEEAVCRRRLRIGRSDLLVVQQASPSTENSGDDQATGYVYHFDPTKPAGVLARQLTDEVLQRAAGRDDVVATEDRKAIEPGGRYIDFLVPGLLGLGLMGGGLWGVGFAIVDLRIRKLLKRFLATPMKREHFLGAIMLSRMLFGMTEVLMLLVLARVAFGVTNFGSLWLLLFVILLGAFEFSGIGLLVASRPQKLETVSGLMNLVMLPMWIGSGVFFSVERFPEWLQPALALLPLTPLIKALRAVMLEGAGIMSLGNELLIMLAYTVATFVLALRFFRWS